MPSRRPCFIAALALAGALVVGPLIHPCRRAQGQPREREESGSGAPGARPASTAGGTAPGMAAPAYPWRPASTDRLDGRLAPPRGYMRVAVGEASFGAFLRALPLLPAGSAVVDFAGRVVRSGDDPRIAAVVDIDVGHVDLQQCADAVVRMNAEWHYSRGDRGIAYRVSDGTSLSYDRYLAGERAFASGARLLVKPAAGPRADDHRAFRAFLDEVFAWANTASLEREGAPVAFADVRAGDFFVMSGKPFGHAVLVLDVARSPGGRTALLLGQSYMPAQSFQVLRPFSAPGVAATAWFVVEEDATEVETPFWMPFPLGSLRRLP